MAYSKGREKGKSLLICPSDYTVIDLETTGLSPEYDEIIEVACVQYRDGQETERIASLIQPGSRTKDNRFIEPFIESLTGITNHMLETAPRFEDVGEKVWDFLEGEFIVGHNVNFDINFLYDNFLNQWGKKLCNDFLDTMRLSRRVLPELESHTLENLSDYFDVHISHHRALNDCLITHEVAEQLKEIACSRPELLEKKKYASRRSSCDLRTLICDGQHICPDHIFYKRHCVFTGKLEKFTRKEAAQMVVNIGGFCDNTMSHETNFLIVGNLDFVKTVKNGQSSKIKKAQKLMLLHQDLHMISENVFYELMEDML